MPFPHLPPSHPFFFFFFFFPPLEIAFTWPLNNCALKFWYLDNLPLSAVVCVVEDWREEKRREEKKRKEKRRDEEKGGEERREDKRREEKPSEKTGPEDNCKL